MRKDADFDIRFREALEQLGLSVLISLFVTVFLCGAERSWEVDHVASMLGSFMIIVGRPFFVNAGLLLFVKEFSDNDLWVGWFLTIGTWILGDIMISLGLKWDKFNVYLLALAIVVIICIFMLSKIHKKNEGKAYSFKSHPIYKEGYTDGRLDGYNLAKAEKSDSPAHRCNDEPERGTSI